MKQFRQRALPLHVSSRLPEIEIHNLTSSPFRNTRSISGWHKSAYAVISRSTYVTWMAGACSVAAVVWCTDAVAAPAFGLSGLGLSGGQSMLRQSAQGDKVGDYHFSCTH